MNLTSLTKFCDKDIPIRIVGDINYFSFELLDTEDNLDISIKESELILNLKDSFKTNIYFSDSINCDINLNTLISKKRKPTLEEPLVITTGFSYSDSKDVSNFTPIVTFTPLTCDHKDLFKLNLSIDALIFVSNDLKLSDIYQLAVFRINEQVLDFRKAYLFLYHDLKNHKIKKLIALNYEMENNEVLTIILPAVEINKEEIWRKEISNDLNLPWTLQRCQSLFPPNGVLEKLTDGGEKLVNPHSKMSTTFPDCHLVKGRYTYYHYNQDNFNDKGWGCAYRSLQTIVSWFVWQGLSKIDIPSHRDIQLSLVRMGDKETGFINSHSWIGSFEINLVLQDLMKTESRIISLTKGSDLIGVYDDLKHHFLVSGAPVMIGGGQLAHTIIGVSKDESAKIRFLILDPHYVGSPTDLATILGKGWCGWKELSFWKENLPYNLCLPLCPR